MNEDDYRMGKLINNIQQTWIQQIQLLAIKSVYCNMRVNNSTSGNGVMFIRFQLFCYIRLNQSQLTVRWQSKPACLLYLICAQLRMIFSVDSFLTGVGATMSEATFSFKRLLNEIMCINEMLWCKGGKLARAGQHDVRKITNDVADATKWSRDRTDAATRTWHCQSRNDRCKYLCVLYWHSAT